jgi:hypothetical protein
MLGMRSIQYEQGYQYKLPYNRKENFTLMKFTAIKDLTFNKTYINIRLHERTKLKSIAYTSPQQ